ncbi:MAG: hypothetical protein FJ290_24080 [Planctomycetes bacterium]|nr:hypothetical protein [Planctomycetota bacterium]
MVKHGAWVLAGIIILLGLPTYAPAGEGEAPKEVVKKDEPAPKEKTVDPLASIRGKLTAARLALIKSKPELAQEYKQFAEREEQIRKDREAFYAKLRTLSPDIDKLEKEKEELEAERKRKDEEARKAKAPKPKAKAKE